jgi:serine/threonine protein kinase
MAKNKTTGEMVAIKIMSKATIIKQAQIEHVRGECLILGSISHPFIVKSTLDNVG